MDISTFLARAFGLYLIIICLAVLFRFKSIQSMYDEMVGNKAFVFLAGFLSLIIGILVVVSHSVFRWDWRVIITLLGYLALIKGIMLMFFPENALKFKSDIIKKPWYRILIIVFLLIGVYLLYQGFWMHYYY